MSRRRGNRRITVASSSVVVWIAGALHGAVRRSLVVLKALAWVAALAGAAWAGQQAVRHVIASPRFALREIRVNPTARVNEDQLLQLVAYVKSLGGAAPGGGAPIPPSLMPKAQNGQQTGGETAAKPGPGH